MKIQLKKSLTEKMMDSYQYEVKELELEGSELEERLKYYLSKFSEGILDPDVAGRKPDKFVTNLQNGVLGDFSNRYIITASDSDEIIGILIGMPEENQRMHIYALHVCPQYRNKGVGSTLLSKCINDMYMNEVQDIILDVHISNSPAYNLYKKFNFIEV